MMTCRPLTFFQGLAGAPPPQPADKSALGSLPVRGYRYCEPLRAATGFGYYIYPPVKLTFSWNGGADLEVWMGPPWERDPEYLGCLDPGEGVQEPEAAAAWDSVAPECLRGCLYPLVIRSTVQPNFLQLWTGWLIATDPEWGTLVRAPVNLPRPAGYDIYEGFVETDQWFGPVFANIVLTKTDTRITVPIGLPLCQVQAIPRAVVTQQSRTTVMLGGWTDEDYRRYDETVVRPSRDPERPHGAYAIRTRQRSRP
jgi:hypothetical protein